MCKNPCPTCPFACTEESEKIQNYGCLPQPHDIVRMKKETNQNWACHSNDKKMCVGLQKENEIYNLGLDLQSGGLIKYNSWYHFGEELAIQESKGLIELEDISSKQRLLFLVEKKAYRLLKKLTNFKNYNIMEIFDYMKSVIKESDNKLENLLNQVEEKYQVYPSYAYAKNVLDLVNYISCTESLAQENIDQFLVLLLRATKENRNS